jgi:hypothetical protein
MIRFLPGIIEYSIIAFIAAGTPLSQVLRTCDSYVYQDSVREACVNICLEQKILFELANDYLIGVNHSGQYKINDCVLKADGILFLISLTASENLREWENLLVTRPTRASTNDQTIGLKNYIYKCKFGIN